MSHLKESLKKITLFSELSTTELTQLNGYFQPFFYEAGEKIISQAGLHRGLYLILSGSVEIRLKTFGGGELSIAKLKAFDAFGEVSLITHYPATANVIAESAVSGLLLTHVSMETVSIIYPKLADKIKYAIALGCCQRSRLLLKHLLNKATHQQVWSQPKAFKKTFEPEIDSFNTNSLDEFLQGSQTKSLPIPFFNELNQDELALLNSIIRLKIAYKGDSIKDMASKGRCFYGLLWGAVQAVLVHEHILKVSTYGPGKLFGTMEYVDQLKNPYHYVAREDAIYFSVHEANMMRIKTEMPFLWNRMMKLLWSSVGEQMSNVNWIFLQLSVEDVYQISQGESHV